MIQVRCTQALNILDRFHIVAKMNTALDEVRAGEARQLVQDGFEPVLKKSRWCLLKRKGNLTSNQRIRLRDLLHYNLKSVRAYLLKEDFQQFWEYIPPTWAGKNVELVVLSQEGWMFHGRVVWNNKSPGKDTFSGVIDKEGVTFYIAGHTEAITIGKLEGPDAFTLYILSAGGANSRAWFAEYKRVK